ncbi:MAG: hypothetical protein HRT73_11465, partial [Flavobacteriales bacterium]|nr:hypothetical protein [Flavobacteriales bacterium]
MEHNFLHTEVYKTPCPKCKAYSFPISKENMSNYFLGKEIVCKKCDTKQDWWSLLLRHFDWEVPSYLFAIVGGFTTSLMIKMKVNEMFTLDLEKIGIPNNAKILQINYTPNGKGLLPIEIHGNVPFRHYIPNKINLFGMPFGEATEETPIAIQICWIHNSSNNEISENLINSVEAFSLRKYNSCIIPSNVSVESTLGTILSDYLNKYAGKE